ncbi:MAG: TonB-dependent receptor [Sporocytophaga sp.]|uniref:TonB-dependent receptor n=1 Tax=Sporocytophaga sp. TaxID=2231183 RepID=UPI001B094D5E|nr:TonB-dependent receptor [Sporocytophaga sp.]MBO9701979.1 TonB-dependent receptor [Sporocytophaga sp.]
MILSKVYNLGLSPYKGRLLLLVLVFLVSFKSYSQTKHTISGIVKDSETGDALIGATVSVKEAGTGTVANENGYYSFSLPEGNYTLMVNFFGYKTREIKVDLKKDVTVNISMSEDVDELKEVVVTTEKKNDNITKAEIGVEKLEVKEINKIPVLLGEKDIIKSIQLIPGVKSGEGTAGFYVRGGGVDQNLVLLDDAPIYNASHLLGFFSVFNSDAINDLTIYKGGIPAQFGGRLSSVLDIKSNEGNYKKVSANGGIGLISSRLNIEAPIVKDKASIMVAGRRSYADLFLKLSPDEGIKNSRLYFYDLNGKLTFRLGEKDRVFISGYFGRDVLGYKKLFNFDWGNAAATVKWMHTFNDKWYSSTSLIHSDYRYRIKLDFSGTSLFIISKINNDQLKQDFQYVQSPRSKFNFGVITSYLKVVPGIVTTKSDNTENEEKLSNKVGWENAAYVSHEFKYSEKLNFIYGLRLTSFSVLGPGDFLDIDKNGNTLDTTTYGSGKIVKTYLNLEPRFAASYIFNEKTSIKASYCRTTQNVHLLSNSTSGSPTDQWIPTSKYVKPEIGDQVSVGYFRNFNDDKFQFSAEAYYKNMQNQVDFKNNAELSLNNNVENQILIGKGRAYGIEFFLKKKYGKFNGWIGYTISKTERKFDLINDGAYYPAKQDRRHDISIVGIYELSPKWTLSGSWVYYTGNAITFPSGKYYADNRVLFYYGDRNQDRMPDYHRLDIGATWIRKKTEKFESSWTFSIYNLYGRANPYMIYFRENKTDASKTEAVKVTLFKMVPSFTYNFKF